VVDALDECEKEDDVRTLLQLWSDVSSMIKIRIGLFLTSRPELPIRQGFSKMLADTHQDVFLHEVPRPVVEHDILIFLTDAFAQIRCEYNVEPPSGTPETIALRLRPLHSVLSISSHPEAPIRLLHLSFGEFLTSQEFQERPYHIENTTIHSVLTTKCLKLLSLPRPVGLCEDMCQLSNLGQARKDLPLTTIA